ncbi:MAG: hypothetical protein M0T80_11355 [Actinomycetota bacterium]|nr:hypothetical protein [Actinomycetota bacterium]
MDEPPVDPLDPDFCSDLQGAAIGELRRRRALADEQETGYSYLRRMIQGRLDIVAEERARRTGEATDSSGPSSLIERLPSILASGIHAPGRGRLPQLLDPGEVDSSVDLRLDEIVSTAELTDLPSVDDARLDGMLSALADLEREVSATRRALQDVVDAIAAEIVRRYRVGDVPLDGLP